MNISTKSHEPHVALPQNNNRPSKGWVAHFAHNSAFLPPLSKFRISDFGFRTFGSFARAMTTLLFVALMSLNGFAQTPTLTASTVTNPTICGGTGQILFLTTNIPNGSYAFSYRELGTTIATGVNVTVAGNQFLMTSSTLRAGTYEGFEIFNSSTGASIATTNVQKTLTNPPSPTLTAGNVTNPTTASATDGSIAFTSTNLSNAPHSFSFFANSGSGSTLRIQNVQASGNAFSLTGLSAGTYFNFTIRDVITQCSGFDATSKTLTVAQTCTQVATATEQMTWTGSVSTDWNNACNWSPNGIPTATNPVRIDDVANDPVISTTVTVPLVIINGGFLTVNNGATLNVTGYDYPSNGSFYGIVLLGGTFTNNGTTNIQPNAGSKIDFPLYAQNLSATFNNNGIFTESASAAGIYSLYSANLTLNNSSTATVNLSGDGYGVRTVNGSIALNNLGTINYTGTGYALVLNLGTITNSNLINISSGSGINLEGSAALTNNACGKILLSTGDYNNSATGNVTTNAGLIQINNALSNSGTFTNNGVLKYGSLSGTVTNNQNSSVIVKNTPTPIFTYGGTYNGTINGIFTNAAANTSAGTFTAPNTFAPSGLPLGSQTLYAKITPSGGACSYVVPFTYNNTTCSQVATATERMTWTGAVSTDWNNACNWSPNGVPTATNPVQIDDVANDPVIMSGTVANFFNMNLDGTLTINNGGELKRLSGSNGIMINLGANSTLTNNGTLNLYTFNGNSLITLGGNNATFNNSGTANFSLEEHNLASIDLLSTNVKVNNTATGIMNFQNNSKAFFAGNNSTGTVTNQGIINYYTGIGYFADLKPNITFNNSGTVDVRNGQGFYIGGATLNNQACGKFYTTKYDNRNSSTTTNSGLMVITTSLSNSGGFFTNNGVLKYSGTPGNAITNNQNSSVIVNNALPIFTYGSSFNGTINGIFTDAAATTSAGTFTAPNTFTPSSGLPSGSQILYAKITPSGGACSYVVPFTYVPCNITLTAGTATNTTTCGGANGSIAFTSTNLPNGMYDLSFTATGAGATASPQRVTVSGNAFNLSGLKAGTYSNFSLTVPSTGCTGTVATSKTVNNPATPTLVVGTRTHPTTCGGTEGTIVFTTTNLPNGNYTLDYSKNGTATSALIAVTNNAFTLSNLGAGTYTPFSITVNGCMGSVTTSRTLNNPAAPTLTAGIKTDPTTCGGTEGVIPFTSTNLPDGMYDLSFTATGAGATTSPQRVSVVSNAFNLSGLKAGTYTNFSVTNNNNCTGTSTASRALADPIAPTLTAGGVTNTTTCGGTNGRIAFTTANLPNGTYELTYTEAGVTARVSKNVSVSSNAFNLLGLKAGTYSNFSITYNGCTATDATSKPVNDPTTPTIVAGTAANPTTCGGVGSIPFTSTNLADGRYSLGFTATGTGATTSPQDVMVSGNAFTLSGLTVGTYSNFSLTRTGCTATHNVSRSIANPATPTLAAGVKVNPTTCGGTDGSIPFTTSLPNGMHQLTYTGAGSPKMVNVTSGAFTLSGLAAGGYSNFSVSLNGCIRTITASRSLNDPNPPVLTLGTATNPTACNLADGSIPFTATNLTSGTYALSYSANGVTTSKNVNVSGAFTLSGLADGTYSDFSIQNASGCTGSLETEVTLQDLALPVLTISGSNNPTTCSGTEGGISFTSTNLPDGRYSLSFTTTGTTSPKDVDVSGNAFTLLGLAAGNYSNFSITRLGCMGSVATLVGLTAPATPSVLAGLESHPTTCGGAEGEIDFTTTNLPNGRYSLSFTASSGATASPQNVDVSGNAFTLTGLKKGTYSNFSITNNNCTGSDATSKMLNDPASPTITAGSLTSPSSCGLADGSIAFTSTNLPDDDYTLTYKQGSSTRTQLVTVTNNAFSLTGLVSGDYSNFSLTSNGCTASDNTTKRVVPGLRFPISAFTGINPTTCGGSDGKIPFTTSLPNGNYNLTYYIGTQTLANLRSKSVNVTGGAFELTDLSAGTYLSFNITYLGCDTYSANNSETLNDPTAATLTAGTPTNPTTCGGSDGTIPFTTSLANGSYTMNYTGGTGSQMVNVASGAFNLTGLTEGTYSGFSITHGGCTSLDNSSKTLSDPNAPTITLMGRAHILCNGSATGGFSFSVSGGTVVVKDAVNNTVPTTGTNPYTVSNVAAGVYTISVTNNGCSASQNVELTQPATPLSMSTTKTDVTVNGGNNGTITVTASGGTGALQFSKDGGTNYTAGTSPFEFNTLTAGTYDIRVKDANGCESTVNEATITQPTAVDFSTTKTFITCYGSSTGAIQVNVTAGTSPFEFSKDDGATFTAGTSPFIFHHLRAGTYKIKVKDNTGFITTASSVVLPQPDLIAHFSFGMDVSINGGNDGKITVTAGGGTGALQFSKDGGVTYTAGTSPFEFNNLTAATYQIRVKDANGCETGNYAVTISQPTAVSFVTDKTDIACNGASTGAIEVDVTAGTSPFEYSKDDGATFTAGTNPFIFNGLAAGTYKIKVKDQTGFITSASSVTLSQPTALSLSTNPTNVSVNGGNDGKIIVTASGGTGALQFSKDGGTNYTAGTSPFEFNTLTAATYQIRVKDANGCETANSEVTINQAAPTVVLNCPSSTTTTACQTQSAVNNAFSLWLLTASATGGCDGVLSNNNIAQGGAPPACGGSRMVTFTYTSTCLPLTTTCQATFTVPAAPTVSLTCPVNTTTTACQTQAAVDAAFATWLATASGTGGCNGTLTNNSVSLGGAPPACGGSRTVTFIYRSTCGTSTTTCQATFTVPAAPTVTLTCPTNTTTTACQTQAAVDAAFATWLATASGTGGCNGTLTNNSVALGGAPSACGGSRMVTFTYTSSCAPTTTTCQATFTVPAAPTVSLTCPTNQTEAFGQTQAAINAKFATWLATASGSGGCNGALSNINTGAPPATGGTATLTFTYTSSCAPLTTTCQASFSVSNTPPVVLTCPVNATASSACLTQAQLTAEYNAWLATASGSGGCTGVLTHDGQTPPSICSATATVKTVTFTYTSDCAPLITTCQATFTVPAYPDFNGPPNSGAIRVCLAQTEQPIPPVINDACGKPITPTGPVVVDAPNPLTCEGTRTYIFTYTDCAGHSHDWSFVWTLDVPTLAVDNPGTATVSCPSAPPPTYPNTITDACGRPLTVTGPTVTSNLDPASCEGTKTYTWNLTDCAGNTNTWSWIITIERNDFTLPANGGSTVACPAAANVVPTPPSKMSECGEPIIPTGPVVSATPACEGTKTYTWTYTDCEGNSHDWVYTYTIERNDFTLPANGSATVACLEAIIMPTPPTVMSNCGETITPTGPVVSPTPANGGIKTYTWTYTDCEGNSHDWVFTYTLNILVNPVISYAGTPFCQTETNGIITLTGTTGGTFSSTAGLTIDATTGTINPSTSTAGTYTVTYTIPATGGCAAITATASVTVNALPTVGITGANTICIGLTTTLTPTTGGTWASSSDAIATVSNAGVVTGVSNGTATFRFTQTSTGCTSVATSEMLVNPTPSVSATNGNQTICTGGTIATMVMSGSITNTVYNWTRDKTSEVTGIAASGTGNISGAMTNTTNAPVTVTFTITPSFTNFGTTCNGTPITATVVVNPMPTISGPANLLDNNTTGQCGKNITYNSTVTGTAPIAITYKYEGATTGAGSGIGYGSFFNVGKTTVTLTATNSCGVGTYSFDVTINDTEKPTFTRPADITIYTDASCSYNADPSVTGDVTDEKDNCSTGLNATFSDVVSNGTCEGTKIITRTWKLQDLNGNKAADQVQTITVSDNIKPTFTRPADKTIFYAATVGACTYNATPSVTGDVVDEKDNCTATLNATYTDVTTNGSNNSKIITRTWTLVDACGNKAADQVQTITVQDDIKPTITCPPSQTLALGSFECARVVVFADPSVSDNCSATFARVDNLQSYVSGSSYSPGTYNLKYRATDLAGNTSDCNFTIQVNGQLTSGRLTCIPTLTVSLDEKQCINTLDATGLLINNTYYCAGSYSASIPGRTNNYLTSADIGKTFTVTVADNSNNTCSTVVTVVDTKAPVLNAPLDAVVTCADVSSDGRILTNLSQPTIIYECGRTTFRTQDRVINLPSGQTSFNTRPDGFPADKNFDFTSAFNASRIIVRTYTATDESNNISSVQQIIYVRSIDLSQVECPRDVTLSCTQSGFSTDIQSAGIPFVRGGRSLQEVSCGIDYLFSDERTNNAQGYVIRRTFTLINRSNNVRQTCTQTITVNCVNIPLLAISGSINKETGESVSATVKIFQANNPMTNMQSSNYLFNQLVQGNSYRIQPERDNDVMNGVTTFDIALLSKHILDLQPFTSPYQMIAADVNRDGEIDGSDMLLIRNLILRRITRFPSNTAWRFIPKNFVFRDNKNPFADDFPEVLNYNNLSSNINQADFVAVKVGDVNLSSRTAEALALSTRTARPIENIYLTDKKMETGKEYIFDLNIKNSTLNALQLALKIDKSNVTSFTVQNGNLPEWGSGNVEINEKEGIIAAAWANTSKNTVFDENSIIQLKITPRQSAWLHELVSLDEQNMENLAYDTDPSRILGEGGIEKQIKLKFNAFKTENLEFALHQNRPNPFIAETMISFVLPETNNAILSIYDVNGREVYTMKQGFNKGYNEVKLDNTVLKNAGIYFYRLQSDKFTATKRMQFFIN